MSQMVKAAGGVVVRIDTENTKRTLLVHRPRYNDWTFPKGKRDPGESDEQCALREVEEETGLLCALGDELTPVTYTDHRGRPKTVRYWLMTIVTGNPDQFVINDEVDEVRWVSPTTAAELLTYPHDRVLLDHLPPR